MQGVGSHLLQLPVSYGYGVVGTESPNINFGWFAAKNRQERSGNVPNVRTFRGPLYYTHNIRIGCAKDMARMVRVVYADATKVCSDIAATPTWWAAFVPWRCS